MSRPKKKVESVIEDAPVNVKESIAEESVEEPVVEQPVAEPAQTVDEDERTRTLEWATRYIGEHSRRRPGSVSGMMNTVYRITISGGRVKFFTLPINVEECAVEESWKRCKPYMSSEEFIAFLTRVLGIAPPPFYSVFRIININ